MKKNDEEYLQELKHTLMGVNGLKAFIPFTLLIRILLILDSQNKFWAGLFHFFDLFTIIIVGKIISLKSFYIPCFQVYIIVMINLHNLANYGEGKTYLMNVVYLASYIPAVILYYDGVLTLDFLNILVVNSLVSTVLVKHTPIQEAFIFHAAIYICVLLKYMLYQILLQYYQEKSKKETESFVSAKKNELIAITSHELRNPLQALTFSIKLLSGMELSPSANEIIDDAQSTIYLLNSIIENILDFSKLTSKKLVLKMEKMSILSVMEKIVDIFTPAAREKGVLLLSHVSPKIPLFLQGDSTRLSQSLSNFCNNAVKFTKFGKIILKADLISSKPCVIKFSCIDTGMGIKKDEIDKLFHPFSQLNSNEVVESKGW